MTDGNRLIRPDFEDQVIEHLTRPNPLWTLFPPGPPPPPPTRRQRLRMRLQSVRWWIHDRYFNCGCCEE